MGSERSVVRRGPWAVEVSMGWRTGLGLEVSASAEVHKGWLVS